MGALVHRIDKAWFQRRIKLHQHGTPYSLCHEIRPGPGRDEPPRKTAFVKSLAYPRGADSDGRDVRRVTFDMRVVNMKGAGMVLIVAEPFRLTKVDTV